MIGNQNAKCLSASSVRIHREVTVLLNHLGGLSSYTTLISPWSYLDSQVVTVVPLTHTTVKVRDPAVQPPPTISRAAPSPFELSLPNSNETAEALIQCIREGWIADDIKMRSFTFVHFICFSEDNILNVYRCVGVKDEKELVAKVWS